MNMVEAIAIGERCWQGLCASSVDKGIGLWLLRLRAAVAESAGPLLKAAVVVEVGFQVEVALARSCLQLIREPRAVMVRQVRPMFWTSWEGMKRWTWRCDSIQTIVLTCKCVCVYYCR